MARREHGDGGLSLVDLFPAPMWPMDPWRDGDPGGKEEVALQSVEQNGYGKEGDGPLTLAQGGLGFDDMFPHAECELRGEWLWVRKGSRELVLGFPALPAEIRREEEDLRKQLFHNQRAQGENWERAQQGNWGKGRLWQNPNQNFSNEMSRAGGWRPEDCNVLSGNPTQPPQDFRRLLRLLQGEMGVVEIVIRERRGIKLVGFGIPGQGFFSLHVDIPVAESEKILVRASVVETAMTEEAVDELMAVWVKIFGIPNIVREIAELVGEFELLDEKSLNGDGPVRVRVACKDPNELFVSMLIYINKVGYKVWWEPEGFKRKAFSHPPSPKDQKDNDDADDLDGEDDKESCLSEKMTNPLAMVVWEENEMGICTQETQEDKVNGSAEVGKRADDITEDDNRGILPSCLGMDMAMGLNERCEIPTDFDIERMRAEEAMEELDSFEVVSSRKTRKKKENIPILVKRKSDRNKGQAVPVQKRAEFLAKKKNLDNSEDIATKAGLCLGKDRGEIDRNIATIKAKELAQAALAECEWKKKQDKNVVMRDEEIEVVTDSVTKVERVDIQEPKKRSRPSWTLTENFKELVIEKMPIRDNDYILNFWNRKLCSIRKFLKGWGANKNSEWKRAKQELVSKLESFDLEANLHDLCPEQWEERYKEDFWSDSGLIPKNVREDMDKPFEMELDKVISQAKNNTAPGPDGFSIQFYKFFWDHLKKDLYEMLIMLYHGELDLKRLNFGVITLIPKCNEANNIRQFRPICVLNDCFKIISKVITNRLSLIASDIISHTQTAFIPGMKINYHKSDVFSVGVSPEEELRVADMLNCKAEN
uniref:Reverse transcriptase domain-containing protein n=1 Tax=Oryza brachyantha TaxID=4533 RepID=J3L8N5_ORYBR